ncbi:hypothetical protein [Deinococcus planocerae]|uniref:hypothetical protein n=1 Tax=Deinococcus planocerae TaxID=1737569 RepID=UPI0011AF9489|nr:hypothetical protein [Deinococcus planocerae]
MASSFLELSWSAVSAGWPDEFLTVADVRELAAARILAAEGEALIPLSELVGLRDDEDHRDVQDVLTRLAKLEERPSWFARREWQVFRLEWQLDHLHDGLDPEEPELDTSRQVLGLEWAWRDMGRPLDMPPLNPFIRSHVPLADETAGLTLTVQDIRVWISRQREMLMVVARLLAERRGQDVAVLALAFEAAQTNAESHLNLVRQELNLYQNLMPQAQDKVFWQKVEAYNSAVLEERRRRSGNSSR